MAYRSFIKKMKKKVPSIVLISYKKKEKKESKKEKEKRREGERKEERKERKKEKFSIRI